MYTQLDCAIIFKDLSFFQEWLNVPHGTVFMLGTKEIKNTVPMLRTKLVEAMECQLSYFKS